MGNGRLNAVTGERKRRRKIGNLLFIARRILVKTERESHAKTNQPTIIRIVNE